jgi:hypothetical protein
MLLFDGPFVALSHAVFSIHLVFGDTCLGLKYTPIQGNNFLQGTIPSQIGLLSAINFFNLGTLIKFRLVLPFNLTVFMVAIVVSWLVFYHSNRLVHFPPRISHTVDFISHNNIQLVERVRVFEMRSPKWFTLLFSVE